MSDTTVLDREQARKFAPVLERMVEICGAEDITFGDALRRASAELGIEVPSEMQGPLLISMFKIFTSSRIPGAPDA